MRGLFIRVLSFLPGMTTERVSWSLQLYCLSDTPVALVEWKADSALEMRSLYLNLKDKGNPALRNEIVLGYISSEKVANMSKEVCLTNILRTE